MMKFLTLIIASAMTTSGAFASTTQPTTAAVAPAAVVLATPAVASTMLTASTVASSKLPESMLAAPTVAAPAPTTLAATLQAPADAHKKKWAFFNKADKPIEGTDMKGNVKLNKALCFKIAQLTKEANGKFSNFPLFKARFEKEASELEGIRKSTVSEDPCGAKVNHAAPAKVAVAQK